MMKALLCLSLLLVLLRCCLEKSEASKIQFQDFDMGHHLSSASVCNRASTAGFKNRIRSATVLEVVHRHSPCAQMVKHQHVNLPSFAKILANDQLRVKSIQARVVKPVDSINTNKYPKKFCRDKRTQIPAQLGNILNINDFIVTIGLGTPERRLSLEFDTGSELIWTQCEPCIKCYPQKDPIFNPSVSTTFSNISCNSTDCTPDKLYCYNNVTCAYRLRYGDHSHTNGFLSKDKITLTPNDVIEGILFGCSHDNVGQFGLTDGLIGLNRGPLSFVSQTEEIYNKFFSYCLPSNINSTGFLAFGKNNKATKKDNNAMIFTPFNQDSYMYGIEITAISVGRARLKINGSVFTKIDAIIDSGRWLTRLPMVAYKAMSKEFKNQMKILKYKIAQPIWIFDTCFYFPRHTTIVKTPSVSFTFLGNATITLDASGVLYIINSTHACLAFDGNSDPNDVSVFGSHQQKKFEVAYDVAENKLGFAYNPDCQ